MTMITPFYFLKQMLSAKRPSEFLDVTAKYIDWNLFKFQSILQSSVSLPTSKGNDGAV